MSANVQEVDRTRNDVSAPRKPRLLVVDDERGPRESLRMILSGCLETEILRESLESHHWNQTRTANALGITRRVLKLKMDKLGIESPEDVAID